MRSADRLMLFVAILVPMAVAFFGWPILDGWLNPGLPPELTAAPARPSATSVPPRRTTPPTPRPTAGAPPTVLPTGNSPTATPESAPPEVAGALDSTQVATLAVTIAPNASANPAEALSSFYALVSSHEFDTAATLWSPRMRAAFPPQENISQRFSQTESIRLQRADVVTQNQAEATVAVELIESSARAGQQRFVGTWQLVRGSSGWMLDQPNLRSAP